MLKQSLLSGALFVTLTAMAGCGGSTPGRPDAGRAGAGGGAAGSTPGTAGASGTAGAGGGAAGATGTAGASPDGGAAGGGGQTAGSGGAAGGVAGGGGTAGQGGTAGVAEGTGCTGTGTICWDFEEGAVPAGWTPYRNEFTGALVVDKTRAHKGMYALHAKDFMGGAEGQQGGPKKTLRFNLPANFGPTLWGRVFVYTTPARPMSHAGLFNARYPRPNGGSTAFDKLDWYEVATYMQNYMTIWHPPEPPGYPEWVQVSDTPLVLNDWACLEWLFDGANGNNAQAADPRMWLNGTELRWPAPFVFDGTTSSTTAPHPTAEKAQNFTVLETGIYLYQGLPTVSNWWIDDLAVGKQRIGCN